MDTQIFSDGEILIGSDGNRYKIKKYDSHNDAIIECDKCALYPMRKPGVSCANLLPKLFGKDIRKRAMGLPKKSCHTIFGYAYFIELSNYSKHWKMFIKEKEDKKWQ